MLIQNADHSASTLVLPGARQFDSLGAGVFDLPDAEAAELLSFPDWSVYMGELAELMPGLLEPVTTPEARARWERDAIELIDEHHDDPDPAAAVEYIKARYGEDLAEKSREAEKPQIEAPKRRRRTRAASKSSS